MGHDLSPPDSSVMGGFQAIAVQPGPSANGKPVFRAGSDHRKDGEAVGW